MNVRLKNTWQGVIRLPRQVPLPGPTLILGRFDDGKRYYELLQEALRYGLRRVIVCGCVRGVELCEEIDVLDTAARLGDK